MIHELTDIQSLLFNIYPETFVVVDASFATSLFFYINSFAINIIIIHCVVI